MPFEFDFKTKYAVVFIIFDLQFVTIFHSVDFFNLWNVFARIICHTIMIDLTFICQVLDLDIEKVDSKF